MRNRRMLTVTLGIVVALIFGIVVAYAALSSTLNAKFNGVTQSALSWNVGFYTDHNPNKYVDGIANGTSSTGLSCGTASITANSIFVTDTSLSKSGDSCSYSFQISNEGSISAKLSSITAIKPNGESCTIDGSTMTCGNIQYQFSLNRTNPILGTSNTTERFVDGTLKVSYIGTGVSSTTTTQSGGGFQVVFAQA